MTVCFVLPKFTRQPIGGYKIVFEYANRLAQGGDEVVLLFLNDGALQQYPLPAFLRRWAINHITAAEPKWFPLHPAIRKVSSYEKEYLRRVGKPDVCFATGIQTVEAVKNDFPEAKKFYLIQGYENWERSDDYVHSTYRYGFCNIAVSGWLKEIVDRYAEKPSVLLKNPIDTAIYRCIVPQSQRRAHTVGLLYHTSPVKGVDCALAALDKVKQQYPDLTVEMFGMFPRPADLPDWFHYKRGASQEETVAIYNAVQVFLCASVEEGYGLTGLESMACGACLVSTAYKGVLEYAEDNVNALLSPVGDPDSLANHISRLFESEPLREKLAAAGVESVRTYSWEKAIAKLRQLLQREE